MIRNTAGFRQPDSHDLPPAYGQYHDSVNINSLQHAFHISEPVNDDPELPNYKRRDDSLNVRDVDDPRRPADRMLTSIQGEALYYFNYESKSSIRGCRSFLYSIGQKEPRAQIYIPRRLSSSSALNSTLVVSSKGSYEIEMKNGSFIFGSTEYVWRAKDKRWSCFAGNERRVAWYDASRFKVFNIAKRMEELLLITGLTVNVLATD